MSITVDSDLANIEEATAILLEKMPASKVARLLATLQVGTGDYVTTRDQLFAGETVDSLFEQAKTVSPPNSAFDDPSSSSIHLNTMNKNEIYVERREEGDYAVRRPGSERASAIAPTQQEAIERAKEIAPDAAIHVERVRHTSEGKPDKWRNP
ncbi:MAG: DUF2188 domain-containing protein [Chthoniobacter sp.]|nr:DUF2188 domain-containing protein [Chthoniobacter sp.]